MSLTILSISQCVYHFSPPDSWSNIDARRTREEIEMCFTILFNILSNMSAQEKQICDGFKMSGSQPPYLYVPLDVVNLIVEFTLKPPNEYDDVFMEKYTIFISKYSWQDILEITEKRLIQLGCECTIKNYSIECVFYNEQRCVNMPFHVNVFTSSDSENEYTVEFQKRRSGDTLEFIELFAQFIQQDEGCGMVSRSKTGSVLPKPRHHPFAPCPFGPVILNEDALDSLLRMVQSDYFDVSVEGLCLLARLVQTKANCILIGSVPSVIHLFCLFLDNENTEIIYPTLIILKFLLNQHKNLVSQFSLKKGLGQNLGKTYKKLIQDVKKNMM